jgi:hypothetical protein
MELVPYSITSDSIQFECVMVESVGDSRVLYAPHLWLCAHG